MRFERAERVIYDENPLVEVVCQIRFPRIFEIDVDLPVAFQKRLRSEYPIAEVQDQLLRIHASVAPNENASSAMESEMQPGRIFRFLDEDRKWCITLSSSSVSLATESYDQWETFSARLKNLLDALIDVYEPAKFDRVGLRYRNFIVPEKIGLDGASWDELLNANLVAVTKALPFDEKSIIGLSSQLSLQLDLGSLMLNIANAKQQQSELTGYLIDADFYVEGVQKADVNSTFEKLVDFNIQAGGLFRWCITDRLHLALKPRAAE